jgi:spore maturation protein CgeB
VMFYHSLLSDWNHGNAHFLRGVASELISRGHDVRIFEPHNSWSMTNLLKENGTATIEGFRRAYPTLESVRYDIEEVDLDKILRGADLVLVHEWNDHELVARIGEHRARMRTYKLLFHDTHHRSVTERGSMQKYDLTNYDGVLAFGEVIRRIYLKNRWAKKAWTWHEAADTEIFKPIPNYERNGDLVWIGNWGDDERTIELDNYLIEPVKKLGIKATVYGVRYPKEALDKLADAGIEYGGWLPNFLVPEVFSRFRVTVHIPRGPYARSLPGIPTIRPFEALACGIPLVCAPWRDVEQLFTPGKDFLTARNSEEMVDQLARILGDPDFAMDLAKHGYGTVHKRHTCSRRVDELLNVYDQLQTKVKGRVAAV